jgi:alpha-methylacyl-CoA racemase
MNEPVQRREGPLAGLRIVEFAGLGPAPMCAMLLADHWATVLRIERLVKVELGTARPLRYKVLLRGREPIALDLKSPQGIAAALEVISSADALIEGFRPGVMERLGLGPDGCLELNPRLVYGRMTGWGQTGPLAMAAGHDLNYIAVTGALDAIGRRGQAPTVPLNLIGDFGGGSLYLALGVLAALSHAGTSGAGQVVDACVLDGTLSLMAMHYGSMASGLWRTERATNVIDSGAPFYDVYECADGKRISVAPSSIDSSASCFEGSTSTKLLFLTASTEKAGTGFAPRWRASSSHGPARNGVRCWRAPMHASHPCRPWPKRRTILMWQPDGAWLTGTACCSRPWLRG